MVSSKKIIISMSALFLGMAFIFTGYALVVSSASIELKKMGISEISIGIITSCFFVGGICSTIFSHKLVSKVGHVKTYAIFTAIFAISAMIHELSSDIFYWSVLRFMLGFSYYSLVMVIESWLNTQSDNSIRSRVLGFYEIVYYSCFALGTLILSFELPTAKVFLISTFFIILGLIPLNLLSIKEPPIPPKINISFPRIFDLAPLALVCAIIAGMLMNGFFSMAGLLVLSEGLSAKEASYFIVFSMLGGFISQCFFGVFSDKFGRRESIVLATLIAIFGVCIFLFLNFSNFIYLVAFLIGAGAFVLYSLALARANDVVSDKSKCVEVGRALLFSYILGSFISPILIGTMMKFFASLGFMVVYGALLLFLLVFTMFQRKIAAKDRVPFEIMPVQSPVFFEELKDDNSK